MMVTVLRVCSVCASVVVFLATGQPADAAATETLGTNELTPACRAGSLFLRYLNAQNSEGIRGLFAETIDAVGPDGLTHHDPAEFAALEERGFRSMEHPWRFQIVNLVPFDKNGCLMEFSVSDKETGPLSPGAVDHFEVNPEGKITRFIPHFAASWVTKAVANIDKAKGCEKGQKP